NKLTMIHPALRAEVKTDRAIPILSHWFESSVPGLYFVGLTSLRAFGPLYRFVAGCGAAARRVAESVARERSRRSRAVPKPKRDGAATLDRKSTRLNSSHDQISYAVFCLKKKNTTRMRSAT